MKSEVIARVERSEKVLKFGRVAQLVEQVTFNHWVTGSNPVALTITRYQQTVNKSPLGHENDRGLFLPKCQGADRRTNRIKLTN